MFSSEICLFLDEEYLNSHTMSAGFYDPQFIQVIELSLASSWNLQIPENMYERGIKIRYIDPEDEADNYIADRWYFIEN